MNTTQNTDRPKARFRCVLHGSFRKHLPEIIRVKRIFEAAGIEVLVPREEEVAVEQDGFVKFAGEEQADPRLVELMYLHHLKQLGSDGFSYFVNPEGDIGKSASYELGIAQIANMVPGSVVATGGIIEYDNGRNLGGREILLVQTHKWGNRWSVVGGKVRRRERLLDALAREVREETGLRVRPGAHLTTFDQIKDSGYYQAGMQHIFVDYVMHADSRRVTLNDEAQAHVWIPAKEALASLEIEPNARHIVELYALHRTVQGRTS